MNSGILGLVHGNFDKIRSEISGVETEGVELQRCIDVENTKTLETGHQIQTGNVAKEEYEKREKSEIKDGKVERMTMNEIETSSTRFSAVRDELVIHGTGANTFGFDLLGRQAETLIERAEIDLDNFISDHDEATFWQYGFYNSGLNAENGVFYGNDVNEDSTTQSIVKSASANQIGIDYLYGDKPVKAKITESGFVEVYQPSEWEVEEFTQYVIDEVLPYIRSP